MTETTEELKLMVSTYYAFQKERIQTGNRIKALERTGVAKSRAVDLHEHLDEELKRIEKWIVDKVEDQLEGVDIYNAWLRHVPGVGPMLAAGLISVIDPISEVEKPSSLWKYSGQDVVDGKAPKRVRGQKVTWNPFARTLCWKLGDSFVKAGGYYRKVYDRARVREDNRAPFKVPVEDAQGYLLAEKIGNIKKGELIGKENFSKFKKQAKGMDDVLVTLTDLHKFNRAKRKAVKLFIAHLWAIWRDLDGLPTRVPYVVEKLGHKLIPPPTVEQLKKVPEKP
ncbi:MAG: hypothetical protein IB616_01690 [Methanosarcinales archaeon]|nr:MAG: hypothetical protein IB616_01690 [Methanosarcinales archaeon]